jgi:hypothetical protein
MRPACFCPNEQTPIRLPHWQSSPGRPSPSPKPPSSLKWGCAEVRKPPLAAFARGKGAFVKLKEGDGGLIAVSRNGEIAMPFNTPGMFRGAADWKGRFDVAIWRE